MKSQESGNRQNELGRVASLGQSSGESAQKQAQRSPLASELYVELLHELNNAFAAVLMNAQALDCKLPSYSRSKRYIHEIERSAQRGGVLVRRLLDRFPAEGNASVEQESGLEQIPPVAERVAVVANQGPSVTGEAVFGLAPSAVAHAAPAFSSELGNAHRRV